MNIAAVDLNLLKAANALLIENSVTRAAERTGVTQQAMSGQLRRLRELFGDELLVQRGRALVPTPLGTALAQPIRSVLVQAERVLVTRPNFNPTTSRRTFNIASLSCVSAVLIPPLLVNLAQAAPNTSVNLKSLDCRLFSDLGDSRYDVCLINTVWRENQGPLPLGARVATLFCDEFVVVADPSVHPGTTISIEHYAAARHAVVDLGSGSLTSVQKSWINHRLSPQIACVEQSFSDVLFKLPGTGLLGTVQKRLAELWAPKLGLSIFPSPIDIDPLQIEILWHHRDDGDLAQQFLRSELVNAASTLRRAVC